MLTIDPSDLNQLRIMMQSAGSWYVKEDGKTVNIADNQALKDAIKIYKQFVDAGITKQVSGWDSFISAFQKGDVASVPNGCWISSSIQASADQSEKWAVAPIPRLGANSKSINSSNSGGSSWYVLDKVGNSDLAADFLASTFGSSDELMNDLVPAISLVSTLKSASSSKNYSEPSKFYGGQEIFKDFSTWTEKIPTVNYGLYTYQLESIMAEGMQAIVAGEDVDETLKNTQAQAEAAVNK
jgi:lactose/L-arabinose transport system substrate-binding protein